MSRRRQPALFWLLVAFNLVMYLIVIPLRVL